MWKTNQILVVEDTVTLYRDSRGVNNLPARTPDGHRILHVGENACFGKNNGVLTLAEGFESVLHQNDFIHYELPSTIRKVGIRFNRLGSSVHLWRCMSAQEWEEFRQGAVETADGLWVYAGGMPEMLDRLLTNNPMPAAWVPVEAAQLMYEVSGEFLSNLTRPMECISMRRSRGPIAPGAAVMDVILNGGNVVNAMAERRRDMKLRGDLLHARQEDSLRAMCSIISAGEPLPDRRTGGLLVDIHIHYARWCYASVRPVVMNDRQYYVGCINYLTPSREEPIVRRELGVFDANGFVADRTITEAVYAKYLLMCYL